MTSHAFVPSAEQRRIVQQLAAFGIPHAEMLPLVLDARGKPIGLKTLRKHFHDELAQGEVKANSRVAQCLFKKATGGDTIAMIFWLKCRASWRDHPPRIEVTGANGGPIRYRSMSDDELEAIAARARKRRPGPCGGGTAR
jgi:hypothetical protein